MHVSPDPPDDLDRPAPRSSVPALGDPRARREAGRYVVAGVVGYAVQLGSFALLVHGLGVAYLVAALVAGVLALINNFLLNRHWTFDAAHGSLSRQARNYGLISAVFFGAQLLILHVLVIAGTPKMVGEALSVLAIVPANFLAQRRLAFRPL